MVQRVGGLFDQIGTYDNLRLAVAKALLGKRHRPDARAYVAHLDRNLSRLATQLQDGSLPLGRSHQFEIFDPKRRMITAPCFEERVLHHAILNICEPVFERALIEDSYACRRNKGRVKAVHRAAFFTSRFPYCLKMDIRRYFPTIDHRVLRQRLIRLFKDSRLLHLFSRIIGSHEDAPGCGLPIGALTSQHFANHLLSIVDRTVKHTLRLRGYCRYMDDFVLWADDRRKLEDGRQLLHEVVTHELHQQIKLPASVRSTTSGVDWLGYRIFPDRITVGRRARRRFRAKLRDLTEQHDSGVISSAEFQKRSRSLVAFLRVARVKSWKYRTRVVSSLVVDGQGPPTA